jgi:hypothetical protein
VTHFDESAPARPGGSLGRLSVDVWPVYVGLGTAHPGDGPVADNEPYDDFDYQRGQITWVPQPDGEVVGHATVYAPKGVYTHILFFRGPHPEALQGFDPMEQAMVFDRSMAVEINPIQNQTQLPR